MPTTTSALNLRALALVLSSMGIAAPVDAVTVCTPTEREEFVDGSGEVREQTSGDGHENECDEPTAPPGDEPQVVAHIPTAIGGTRIIAIDMSPTRPSVGTIAWVAQVVVTAPGAPPQVIEVGIRNGRAGTVLAARDAAGKIAFGDRPLPRVGGHYALVAINVSAAEGHSLLAIGAPASASLRWTLAQGASLTLLGATGGDGEPAVVSLGSME